MSFSTGLTLSFRNLCKEFTYWEFSVLSLGNALIPFWEPKILRWGVKSSQRKAFYKQRIPESSCARKETIDIDILVTSRNGAIKIMQYIKMTSRPPSRVRKWNQLSQFRWTSTKVIQKRLKLATFWLWSKGSREAAREGLAVLHIGFCSLSNNSKYQLGAPTQTWQQYVMNGCMVDL